MKTASRKELNLSVEMIVLYLDSWNAAEYLQLLDELKARGANLELLAPLGREMLPAILRLPSAILADFMERFGEYIKEDSTDGPEYED